MGQQLGPDRPKLLKFPQMIYFFFPYQGGKKLITEFFPVCSNIEKPKKLHSAAKKQRGKRKGTYRSLLNVADIKGLHSLQILYRYLWPDSVFLLA